MIKINIEKAKAVAHDIRRATREKEFAPLDAMIMKQIPDKDAQAAETARQIIREKYASIQSNIDAAATPDEIKAALGV
jgi:hypothetical protein